MKPIDDYRPGQRTLRADDLNAQLAELVRQGKLQITGLLELEQGANGPLLAAPPPVDGLWAKLTGRSGTAYAWTEQTPLAGGLFEAKTHGRVGTTTTEPAYEVTRNATVPIGTYVWLERSFAGITAGVRDVDWRFEYCCSPHTVLSGSGSGTGDDRIVTPSCPDGVPRVLVATVSVTSGSCACLDGVTVTLSYNSALGLWSGSASACTGNQVLIYLQDIGGGDWQVTFYCWDNNSPDGAVMYAYDTQGQTSCSPFSVSASDPNVSLPACCGGNVGVSIGITA